MAEHAEQGSSLWVPLSAREDADRREEFLQLREGVPPGAQRSLAEWCGRAFQTDPDLPIELKFTLFEMSTNKRLPDNVVSGWDSWEGFLREDDDLLLEAIDFALRWTDESRRAQLSYILRQSRSKYRVGKDAGDRWVLQNTYSDEMIDLVETTAGGSGRAAEHLRIAWSNIAGQHPDPDKACWEATKAVEVAAKPIITPNDRKATLGKMLRAMDDKEDGWETDLDSEDSLGRVKGMMRIVWKEGRRHGNEDEPIDVSPEAAEIVVQTAVVLVNWLESGFVRRVST